jgi:hypothetical protein
MTQHVMARVRRKLRPCEVRPRLFAHAAPSWSRGKSSFTCDMSLLEWDIEPALRPSTQTIGQGVPRL